MATTHKFLIWTLGALGTLASYIAIQTNNRLQESKEIRDADRIYYQRQIDIRDDVIARQRKEKDSLQGLIISRADNQYHELKTMLDISGKNIITIKPKSK